MKGKRLRGASPTSDCTVQMLMGTETGMLEPSSWTQRICLMADWN